MILLWLILVPLAGGAAAWAASRARSDAPRWIALSATVCNLLLALALWAGAVRHPGHGTWLAELDWPWIQRFGIHFHLALDGLSLALLLLTGLLGTTAVLVSWTEVRSRVGFFHFNLLWTLAGIATVFLAADLFVFYLAWELMLVPMYLLIAIWGHEHRLGAAIKFFLFTQCGGLLMLVSILGLVALHGQITGTYTFDYRQLIGTLLPQTAGRWLMLGFFAAFAVKLPTVPVHSWLPDAHTQAPTAGSVILAGLLLKTGGYGMIRYVLPLFPEAARWIAPAAMVLGVIGILYGALLALGQTDLKRLIAYTSVSHMGFVLLGVFTFSTLALQGAVLQMICHGLSTGALFALAGVLQQRMHTRDIDRMGGLWSIVPRLSAVALFFALASLGLPGLGDFAGEFLVLLGAWRTSVWLTVLAALGVLGSTLYALRLVQRVFQGPLPERSASPGAPPPAWTPLDLAPREVVLFAPLMLCLLWLGLYPQPALDTVGPALSTMQAGVGSPLALRR